MSQGLFRPDSWRPQSVRVRDVVYHSGGASRGTLLWPDEGAARLYGQAVCLVIDAGSQVDQMPIGPDKNELDYGSRSLMTETARA